MPKNFCQIKLREKPIFPMTYVILTGRQDDRTTGRQDEMDVLSVRPVNFN